MRYFIYMSYDGGRYHGWQIQPNGQSVQAVLSAALGTLLRQPVQVTGAGRTDTGVNASLMVAHFDADLAESPADLVRKLNKFLPSDIAVSDIRPVCADAHARFSATSRTYHYHVATRKSPFARYAYHVSQPLDFELMNQAAALLLDYTDFTSFSKLHTDVKTNLCAVTRACWEPVRSQGDVAVRNEWTDADTHWVFTITANRFLRNMVRAVVGTLIDVGRGSVSLSRFRQIIETKDRCAAGMSVPGHALFLADITYPDNIFL